MKEHYLCASCGQSFPTGDAVDGFAQGYRKGFLCPLCNANLEETGESDDILHLRFGLSYLVTMVLVIWLGQLESIQLPIGGNGYVNDVLTVALLAAVPTVAFLMVNWRALFESRTVFTRKIRLERIAPDAES